MNFFIIMNFLKNVMKDAVLDQSKPPMGPCKVPVGGLRTAPFWTNTPPVPPWAWKTIALALGRRYPPAGQNKGYQKGPKPKPATGMAQGDTQGGVGTAGAMG